MTLVEVLVAITVLALLGTLIANGMHLGGRAWNGAERRTENSDDVALLQGLFRRTLTRARPAYASDDPRDATVAFAGETATLSLMAPQPGTQYGGSWVHERFYLARHGQSEALFVELRWDGSVGYDQASANRVMLLDHVAGVRFTYFGTAAPGEPPGWQDRWTGRDRLPDLVRVAIARDDPALGGWPELIVRTRVTANAGCLFDALTGRCRRPRPR